jgi:asparagine synthase (glutamine-hydrolysing)
MRELLARYVPRALFERPKKGFEAPIGTWMRGPLRPWAEDLLARESLEKSGHFNVTVIRRMWRDHLEGRAELGYQLWSVLMFESWLRKAKIQDAPHGSHINLS